MIPTTEATNVAAHQGDVSYEKAAKILRAGYDVDFSPALAELREHIARTVENGELSHLIPQKNFIGRLIRSIELDVHSAPKMIESGIDDYFQEHGADRSAQPEASGGVGSL